MLYSHSISYSARSLLLGKFVKQSDYLFFWKNISKLSAVCRNWLEIWNFLCALTSWRSFFCFDEDILRKLRNDWMKLNIRSKQSVESIPYILCVMLSRNPRIVSSLSFDDIIIEVVIPLCLLSLTTCLVTRGESAFFISIEPYVIREPTKDLPLAFLPTLRYYISVPEHMCGLFWETYHSSIRVVYLYLVADIDILQFDFYAWQRKLDFTLEVQL